MRNILFRISLFLFSSVPITTYSASYYGNGAYGDVGAGLRYDSNLSRAQTENDRKEAFINNFNARYGYQKVLNKKSLVNLSTDIVYERVNEYKALNNLQLGGSVSYFFQAESGYFNPWFEAALRLSHLKFNESTNLSMLINL